MVIISVVMVTFLNNIDRSSFAHGNSHMVLVTGCSNSGLSDDSHANSYILTVKWSW